MSGHAFVDESKRGPYLMCVYVAAPADRREVKVELNRLRPRGAPRLHMHAERDSLRREILSTLCELEVTATVFTSAIKPFRNARARIIEAGIWPRIVRDRIDRLVLEPEVGQDERDRKQLYELTRAAGLSGRFTYAHVAPTVEPMLWVPDAIAWAYGSGGDWRRRADPLIAEVVDVDQGLGKR